jgi:hypothetical protein
MMPRRKATASPTRRVAYTIGEVAAMTGRNRSTIHRWLMRGVLDVVKPPTGERMVSAASFERIFGEQPPSDAPSEPSEEKPLRRGRPRIEGARPWEAEGISRRTWERRNKTAAVG